MIPSYISFGLWLSQSPAARSHPARRAALNSRWLTLASAGCGHRRTGDPGGSKSRRAFLLCVLCSLCLHSPAQEQPPATTRRNTENNRGGGIVITDLKGITMRIGGFMQADFIHDFDQASVHDAFQPSSITVPTVREGNTAFGIRQSRLNFSAAGPTRLGELSALFEFDLRAPDGGVAPRIRHAWIGFGRWGFGQTWSNFMDSEAWPEIIDAQDPNACLIRRQVQVRYTLPLSDRHTLAFSLEDPGADATLPDADGWETRTLWPDATASWQTEWDRNHIRISGLLHPISYRSPGRGAATVLGGAGNFSGTIATKGSDAINFQASYGTGYARYMNDLGGMGYDAMPDPADGDRLRTVDMGAVWLFYDHWWSKSLSSSAGWGYLHVRRQDFLPADAVSSTNYGSINLLWHLGGYFKTGVEVLYGNRIDQDGSRGDNFRIQFSAFMRL